jgi:hypothetical protein
MGQTSRLLIKTVFGRTLFDSDVTSGRFVVVKNRPWLIEVVPAESAVIDLITSNLTECHAFYFEAGRKWWLSCANLRDERKGALRITFDGVYEYKKDELV